MVSIFKLFNFQILKLVGYEDIDFVYRQQLPQPDGSWFSSIVRQEIAGLFRWNGTGCQD